MANQHNFPLIGQAFLGTKILSASVTLSGTDSGKAFSNASASGAITVTLPQAKPGYTFQFLEVAAHNVVVTPQSTDNIRGLGAGSPTTLSSVASLLWLECINTGTWEILQSLPLPSGVTFAAPTALVGLTVIPGSASTAMRSDAAPALNLTISPVWTGNHTFAAAAGAAVTIDGIVGTEALILNSANGGGAAADFQIIRTTSTANSLAAGADIQLSDTSANTHSIWQQSGGQTELWQFNGGWNQILKVLSTRGVVINAPASGNTLTANTVAGGVGLLVNASGAATRGIDVACGTGDFSGVFRNSAGTGSLLVSSPGNVVINAALATSNALGVGGFNFQSNAPTTSGGSFGALISGGTTAGDFCAVFNNAANSANFMQIFGDGGVAVAGGGASPGLHNFIATNNIGGGTLTSGAPTGGIPAAGSVNISGQYLVNNIPLSSGTAITTAVAAATETRTSTVTQSNSTQLTLAISAAGKYAVKLVAAFTAGVGAGAMAGLNYSGTFTAAASSIGYSFNSGGASVAGVNNAVDAAPTARTGTSGSLTLGTAVAEGTLTVTGAGTLAMSFAQQSSSANVTTLLIGSYLQIIKIA